MGHLDPELKRGLTSCDDAEVRGACSLLDEMEACGENRSCRDGFCAFIFYALVAVLICFAASAGGQVLDIEPTMKKPVIPEGGKEVLTTAVQAICIGSIVSLLLAQLFLEFAKRCTECVVWTAILLGPLGLIVGGVVMLPFVPMGSCLGVAMIMTGVCMTSVMCCCWKHLMPFTVLLIQTLIAVLQEHRLMFFISLAASVLCMAWNLLCVFCGIALYVLHREKLESVDDKAAYFVMSFIFLWGSMVASNACHVGCCGVFGRWYFGKDRDSPISKSLHVAFVTSFGSVCFGSALVAFVRATQMLIRLVRGEREADNPVVCILLCLAECMVRCIGDILEWFNEFAYVQCAVRGLGYVDSARATYALCTFSNCNLINADTLVGSVAFLGSIPAALLGGFSCNLIFLYLMMGHSTDSEDYRGIVSSLGFLVALMLAVAVLQPLQSGATTLVVCWAERPSALARTHPQLAEEFARRGHSWDMNHYPSAVPAAALQPQPGAARNVAAVPMMEMQQLPQKQLAVTVPAGAMPGQMLQIRSPEGQLMQVTIPDGLAPGSTFMAAY